MDKENAIVKEYYDIAKKFAMYSEENDFAFSSITTTKSKIMIDENTLESVWLHVGGRSRWAGFVCKYSGWAKTTTDEAGNNPINVRKIKINMSGYWGDGNKSLWWEDENDSYISTGEKTQDCSPLPCDRDTLHVEAYSEGPDIYAAVTL